MIALFAPFLVACTVPETVEAAAHAANPMVDLDRDIDRTPITGTASEVRAAGGYDYVRIADRWVVGLSKDIETGDAVRAAPVGRARGFHSARTGHTYDALWFAVLSVESKTTP